MKFKRRRSEAEKRAAEYPVATIAAYGPNDQVATKIAVGVIAEPGGEPVALQRWFWNGHLDIRLDKDIAIQIADFVRRNGAKQTIVSEHILGCPHEEGEDYPEGELCPKCPYWANRDGLAPPGPDNRPPSKR